MGAGDFLGTEGSRSREEASVEAWRFRAQDLLWVIGVHPGKVIQGTPRHKQTSGLSITILTLRGFRSIPFKMNFIIFSGVRRDLDG